MWRGERGRGIIAAMRRQRRAPIVRELTHLEKRALPFVHLDVLVALTVMTVAYTLVDDRLRVGARWATPAVVVVLIAATIASKMAGRHDTARLVGFATYALATLAIVTSVTLLGRDVLDGVVSAGNLLRDSGLLWVANVLVFSCWYWDLDGGGPGGRRHHGYTPTDFAFPQTSIGGELARGWSPGYVDYLFVAFTASSAFSPTDTMVLSARAKLLMMLQALVSIVTLAVLAARAVNTLRSMSNEP